MTTEQRFIVDQLRKDKIIYAVEATATNVLCLLLYLAADNYLSYNFQALAKLSLLMIATGYTLYMGITNSNRLKQIKKIEKD